MTATVDTTHDEKGRPIKVLIGLDTVSQVKRSKEGIQKLDCSDLKVVGNFLVSNNPLGSLRGSPAKVGGGYFATNCGLTELRCTATEVGDLFSVEENPLLTSLALGPVKVGTLSAYKCGLTELNCMGTEITQGLSVGENPALTSLAGRQNEMGFLNAYSCGLERLECRELVLWGDLDIRFNTKLTTMLDGPRCVKVQCEDVPALGMVGRCETIDIDYNEIAVSTVFRTKLKLVGAGFKGAAKIRAFQ